MFHHTFLKKLTLKFTLSPKRITYELIYFIHSTSRTVPIHKDGNTNRIENFHHINVIIIISKALEFTLYEPIFNTLEI